MSGRKSAVQWEARCSLEQAVVGKVASLFDTISLVHINLVLKILIRRLSWIQQPVTRSGHPRSHLKSPTIQTTKAPLSTLYRVGVHRAPLCLGCTNTLPRSHRARRNSQLRLDWRYLVRSVCVIVSTYPSLFFVAPSLFWLFVLVYAHGTDLLMYVIVIFGLHFFVA